ncbi:MAG: Rieske (2Fe-2S) protein [Cyanobacteria bacterium P01_G01_bin.39]
MKRREFLNWAGIGLLASYLPVALVACSQQENNETSESTSESQSPETTSNVPDEQGYVTIGTAQELNESGYLVDTQSNVIVFGNGNNNLTALSLLCTHQGCNVDLKKSANSLSCACHGSEFAFDGKVLKGPAQSPLSAFEVKAENQLILVKVG